MHTYMHTQTHKHTCTHIHAFAHVCADEVQSSLGTFDIIHVGAAATEAMLPRLISLLSPGGRMVVPVGPPVGLQVRSRRNKLNRACGTHGDS
jgi:protein-L-isoaspartate O-methyltransferase